MADNPIYFNPYASGLEVFLGPSEARIMELCWSKGPLTVKKALFYYKGPSTPAYTTVMTVMARLAKKGLLSRSRDGRNYVYTPSVSRDEFLRERVRLVTDCLKKNFPRKK